MFRHLSAEEWEEVKKEIDRLFEHYGLGVIYPIKDAMKTMKFPTSIVLSVITGCHQLYLGIGERNYFLIEREEISDFLKFVGGEKANIALGFGLSNAMEKCRPYLLKQFPKFATPETKAAIKKLNKTLDDYSKTEEDKKSFLESWLAEQVAKHGETLIVRTMDNPY